MAESPEERIRRYKESIENAESVFKTEIERNGCPRVSISEYDPQTLIGKGAYGEVLRAEKDGSTFAVKQLSKQLYRDKKKTHMVIQEKKYLWAMSSPFIVHLFCAAKDRDFLYLVMEYTPHGDLRKLVKGRKVSEDVARILISQIVMALEYVHACNVIYRDLKAANILVFPEGRLKLADFGIALLSSASTNTFSGTPPYVPPEMINKALYNHTADWWAVGIVLFMMLLDQHPFALPGDTKEQVFKHVLGKRIQNLDDSTLSEEVKDLLRKLLNKDYTERIGGLANGINDIKEHPWFAPIDFDQLIVAEQFYKLKPEHTFAAKETPVSDDAFSHGNDDEDPLKDDLAEF